MLLCSVLLCVAVCMVMHVRYRRERERRGRRCCGRVGKQRGGSNGLDARSQTFTAWCRRSVWRPPAGDVALSRTPTSGRRSGSWLTCTRRMTMHSQTIWSHSVTCVRRSADGSALRSKVRCSSPPHLDVCCPLFSLPFRHVLSTVLPPSRHVRCTVLPPFRRVLSTVLPSIQMRAVRPTPFGRVLSTVCPTPLRCVLSTVLPSFRRVLSTVFPLHSFACCSLFPHSDACYSLFCVVLYFYTLYDFIRFLRFDVVC